MTRKIKKHDAERFDAAIAELNAVLTEVKKYAPKANYYLAMEALCVMDGDSHETRGCITTARQDRIMHSGSIWHCGGGDW